MYVYLYDYHMSQREIQQDISRQWYVSQCLTHNACDKWFSYTKMAAMAMRMLGLPWDITVRYGIYLTVHPVENMLVSVVSIDTKKNNMTPALSQKEKKITWAWLKIHFWSSCQRGDKYQGQALI